MLACVHFSACGFFVFVCACRSYGRSWVQVPFVNRATVRARVSTRASVVLAVGFEAFNERIRLDMCAG